MPTVIAPSSPVRSTGWSGSGHCLVPLPSAPKARYSCCSRAETAARCRGGHDQPRRSSRHGRNDRGRRHHLGHRYSWCAAAGDLAFSRGQRLGRRAGIRSGQSLACSGTDNPQVALLDPQQPGTPRVLAELDPGNLAQAVAVSANGAVLAVATAATDVVLWDVSAGPGSPRQLARLGGFGATVQAVAFSPDLRTLAAGSADKSVQLWDVADPSVPHEFTRQRAVDLGSRRPLLSNPISRPRRLSGPRQRCRLRPR